MTDVVTDVEADDVEPQLTGPIVTEYQVERALSFLRDSAAEVGLAKGEMIRAGHMIKVQLALSMKLCDPGLSAVKAEVEARASEAYLQRVEDDAIACAEYEKLRALRDAAALKIEVWRSSSANYRAMKV